MKLCGSGEALGTVGGRTCWGGLLWVYAGHGGQSPTSAANRLVCTRGKPLLESRRRILMT